MSPVASWSSIAYVTSAGAMPSQSAEVGDATGMA